MDIHIIIKSLTASISLLLCLSSASSEADYPMQKINANGAVVYFGQSEGDFIKQSGARHKPPAKDYSDLEKYGKKMLAASIECLIDDGKVSSVTLLSNFDYAAIGHKIYLFKENWRAFEPIGESKIYKQMKKGDFLSYLKLWIKKNNDKGVMQISSLSKKGEGGQYSISCNSVAPDIFDDICISFYPRRPTGKGGYWGDSIIVHFATDLSAEFFGIKPGELMSITVSCDEFNSRGRSENMLAK